MAVKHKPETALPWGIGHRSKHSPQSVFVRTMARDERAEVALLPAYGYRGTPYELEGSNFAYIVHAANAYPRLVEALREHAHYGTERGTNAINLLAELGESA